MRGLYWVRTDLRLHDNLALNAFLRECTEGIIVWCPSKSTERSGPCRRQFLEDSLFYFNKKLESIGQKLFVGRSDIVSVIAEIGSTFAIDKIYYSSLSAVEEKKEESNVIAFCQKIRCQYEAFDQETLLFEKDLPFHIQEMPFIFSDFRRKVEQGLTIRPPVPLTSDRNLPPKDIQYKRHFSTVSQLIFCGGEDQALKRITHYFFESKAILNYKDTRNGLMAEDDSSRLSPWLSLGIMSPRKIMSELRQFESVHGANESTYWLLFELLWRDYLKFFSRKFQEKIFIEDGVKRGKHYHSEKNSTLFLEWCLGKTPEPFINANMNELNQTGWMSNRGRQNVASYLVHYLKVPWTWGAAYFEEKLIDYDCDLNWGNWLYLSGNGSDPRARIFNIKRQAEVYDPGSLYQKRWAP